MRLLLRGPPAGRHIQRKVRRPRVDLPRQPALLLLLVQPQEDQLRLGLPRVVVLDHLLLGPVEEVGGHELLDIPVVRVRQLRGAPGQRGQLVQEDEARRGVLEGLGEEGVFGAEEGEAV